MRAIVNGIVIAESDTTVVVEGNHYFPPSSLTTAYFSPIDRTTSCPWKGTASYYEVTVDGTNVGAVAWTYRSPLAAAEQIRDHVAFFPKVTIDS